MKRIVFPLFLSLLCFAADAAGRIRVACVGNSVTYGYRIENRERDSYPAQLQRLLGDGYEVGNFGHSGATLLTAGHRPYVQQQAYADALAFAADEVIIHLGLNDTDPRNWPNYRDRFVRDYLDLIDAFRRAKPGCRIRICRMTPIFHTHPRFRSGTRDWFWQEQEAIELIAALADVPLVDLHEQLYARPDLLPDALHPDAEGAAILARTVYSALTGDYGGLQLPAVYTDRMVLQRDRPLRIAGTADAGERVTVRIGRQHKKTTAGDNGRWEVVLDPLQADGKPQTLEIATPARRLRFEEVLAGDVWLCSGQSNMAFRLNESDPAERKAQLSRAAAQPAIRLFDSKARWETNAVAWDERVLDSLNRLEYFLPAVWSECTPETADRFSAVGYAFGRMLADSLQVPVGLILNAVGGSPAEAWIDRRTLEFEFPEILYDWTHNDFIQPWVRQRASQNISAGSNPRQRHPYEPCYLFEAGIRPLERFPIKGVIWYQGESNAHNIEAHERLFPLLVASWRNNWNDDRLPFYFVQLSSIARPSWPHFRDSQRLLAGRIPYTAMAVSSDLGDSLNVHPTHKRAVGERLARLALHDTYGFDLVASGPKVRRVEARGGALYVSFDCGEGLHSADGGELRTFEVAEHDGLFYPAEATVEGDRLRVSSNQVPHPRLIRYAWQPFTRANLVNAEGLPASTFRAEAEPSQQAPDSLQ